MVFLNPYNLQIVRKVVLYADPGIEMESLKNPCADFSFT